MAKIRPDYSLERPRAFYDTGLVEFQRQKTGNFKSVLNPHYGQARAWLSNARYVFVFAGTKGGKTSFAPWWLDREIQTTADPSGRDNDYLMVAPTYDLFKLKLLPETLWVFQTVLKVGRYWSKERLIELAAPNGEFWAKRADDPMWGRIILRSASSGGGLESSTARAAVLDECGHDDFRIVAWESILQRLSLYQGRVLGLSTPYNLGWTKTEVFDKWREGNPDYSVVQFPSIANPTFPKDEFEAAKKRLPKWKFDMKYRGIFERPAGLIYDVFDPKIHKLSTISGVEFQDDYVTRIGGLDFGAIHTAALTALVYRLPGQKPVVYITDEYLEGKKTIENHAESLRNWMTPTWVGGSGSEDQWRWEFSNAGIFVTKPPIKEVEIGIDKVYAAFKARRLFITENCKRLLDEIGQYSRKVDEKGEITKDIRNKNDYHLLDALRYLMTYISYHDGTGGIHV